METKQLKSMTKDQLIRTVLESQNSVKSLNKLLDHTIVELKVQASKTTDAERELVKVREEYTAEILEYTETAIPELESKIDSLKEQMIYLKARHQIEKQTFIDIIKSLGANNES